MHDRGDGVEEGERAFAGARRWPRQARRSQRAGRNDDIVPVVGRQAGDLAALERDERMGEDRSLDGGRKAVAVDGERAAGGHLMGVGASA